MEKQIYALPRAGFGPLVDADGNSVSHSDLPEGVRFFVTTLNELKRAKAENREPIPLQREPITIDDMRRIVAEHDQMLKHEMPG